MYLLTNEQRKCFALSAIQNNWILIKLSPSRYDTYNTYAYITPDNRIVKIIIEGDEQYQEYDVNELLSPDRTLILPKTTKGKPVRLTAANIAKKTPVGMSLSYVRNFISVYSTANNCEFYNSSYAGITLNGMSDFFTWINKWCDETGDEELADIEAFAKKAKRHVKYKEGDFFRFRLDRHFFGYGRIIINYDDLRKKKIPFWDIFMGKPILAGIYHIVTKDKYVGIEELDKMKMIPPQMIMDNIFFYDNCEIIGNLPVDESRIEFPVYYGHSIQYGDKSVMYQCGRTFIQRNDIIPLFDNFRNNGIGLRFNVDIPILMKCVEEQSNAPYWKQPNQHRVNEDLRNPQYDKELKKIRKQFDLE